ncbi:Zeaxanthin epoxidase-chloroplastic-like protein [Lachnellula suecica]|uniref:Zeaxanthin epoxidase-chloroplastic-like protein n=1 Tax=Lachnellula suecica TaxID=602035 RepID=A0A8T9BWH2_9HELO|nr:Zeaxanthin epoxidase-chloroplastic-like protein [Lachnellula suecica]
MSSPRILIIGGGVGGLALAQGLRRRNIDFAVFERDPLLDSRLQGYRLKVFGEFQAKLKDLLTDEAWLEFEAGLAETNLGETTINAPNAQIIASRAGRLPPGAPLPYTIDRGMMRQAMAKGIESSIHFGKKFVRYELNDEGVTVFFADGSSEQGTLLVGADGARSAVRKQLLPDIKPLDTEGCCIYGKSHLTPELLERLPPKHRRWMTVVVDQTPLLQTIISGEAPITLVAEAVRFKNQGSKSDLPEDYVHWGILFHRNTSGLKGEVLDKALGHGAMEMSLQLTSEWDPSIRCLIELQDPSLSLGMNVYSASPDIPAWKPSGSVTVLGDAIHVMSPSGGVGAVATLNDVFELTRIIESEGVSEASIGKFEGAMRGFAKVCIGRSFLAGEKMLSMPSAAECKEVDW